MNPRFRTTPALAALALGFLSTLNSQLFTAFSQGTGFTYQGRLNFGGAPYNGTAEFQPTLWDSAANGVQVTTNNQATVTVAVTNGLFVLPLEFGSHFPGGDRWLQLEVRTTLGPFTTLSPRQQITPAPYAIHSASAVTATSVESNSISATQLATMGSPGAGQLLAFSGSGLVWTNPPPPPASWLLSGNDGTAPGANFLGTTDNQPLELRVNGQRALRIEPNTNGAPNLVGGAPVNSVASGIMGATIGGGAGDSSTNRVTADFGTVSGGYDNVASGFASTVGGGRNNIASGFAATVASGQQNTASGNQSFAAGIRANAVHQGAFVWADRSVLDPFFSTAENQFSVRAGGGIRLAGNVQLDESDYRYLSLSGGNSLGYLYGSFPALADGVHLAYNHYYNKFGSSQILRPDGATSRLTLGYGFAGIYVGAVGAAPTTQRLLASSSGVTVNGTFNNSSDRNAKQDFTAVSSAQMLEKVTRLPISEWSYKDDPATRHVGPMGQDFHSLFNLGTDEKHIAPIDEGGVAFAAIQGLNEKLEARSHKAEGEIEQLWKENAELKRELAALKELILLRAPGTAGANNNKEDEAQP